MSDGMSPGVSMLSANSPVIVRVAHDHDREYASRIEHVAGDVVVVTAPPGAKSALLASGSREVEISWLSPRGRYEQACRVETGSSGGSSVGGGKNWRLRPLRKAVLIQRRRYIRVRANVGVTIDLRGGTVAGSTVDVSEGGFRVRVPRLEALDREHVVVRATIAGAETALPGYVVRTTDVEPDLTEAVVAFEADGVAVDAVRRFVLQLQLRARASRS